MKKYTVYCHTNKINNKKYVGITSQTTYARWQNGKHYNRHKSFYEDIIKYGWDNFNHEIILETNDKNIAERTTGINHTSIIRCCKGIKETAGGFHWKYKGGEVS